ncbi:AidB family quorum-quenching N-acyl homoserine lactonase [Inquilinus limosus]|uniref:Lactamase n=1 Tax=Inquilinus limosus MP06 TaxID=1398085 RepID=A0A0A0DB28_9PROT|nr:MBL fold metallo-hydrolase [Inquilinus limosus]KGM34197.1 lactamase [Inquilinus limosus MP06]
MSAVTGRFGPYDFTVLLDGIFEAPKTVLTHAAGEDATRRLVDSWPGDKISIDVNCYLLRGENGISLIDAGTGDHWGPALGKAPAALAAAGVRPDEVDRVLVTHLHGDHVLGLLVGDQPWLPRAKILVPEKDLAFYGDAAVAETFPPARRGNFKTAAILARAYAGRIRPIAPGPVEAMPGVEAVPLPGHTPGQSGYRIGEGREALLIWADAIHLGVPQIEDPEVGLTYDLDPAQAIESRWFLLQEAAKHGWRVTGSHVSPIGRIEAAGQGWRFVEG